MALEREVIVLPPSVEQKMLAELEQIKGLLEQVLELKRRPGQQPPGKRK
jgi:hypothetical protein